MPAAADAAELLRCTEGRPTAGGRARAGKAKRSEALASDTNCHAVLSAMVFESAYLRTIPSGRADSMSTAKKAIAGVCESVCVCARARACVERTDC